MVALSKLGKLVACDTETTGLNAWLGDKPFAFSFCNEYGGTAYFQFKVDPFTREVDYHSRQPQFIKLKKFFEDPSITKIFHNAKFDVRMLDLIGIKVKGVLHETMFLAHTIDTSLPSLKLKWLAKYFCKIDTEDETA